MSASARALDGRARSQSAAGGQTSVETGPARPGTRASFCQDMAEPSPRSIRAGERPNASFHRDPAEPPPLPTAGEGRWCCKSQTPASDRGVKHRLRRAFATRGSNAAGGTATTVPAALKPRAAGYVGTLRRLRWNPAQQASMPPNRLRARGVLNAALVECRGGSAPHVPTLDAVRPEARSGDLATGSTALVI